MIGVKNIIYINNILTMRLSYVLFRVHTLKSIAIKQKLQPALDRHLLLLKKSPVKDYNTFMNFCIVSDWKYTEPCSFTL